MEDISDAVYMSYSYLSKVFKNETLYSLAEYVRKEKINEAKRLLKYSNRSFSAISNYLNFSSQSHFNNTFKSLTKMTPKEYKKSI